MKSVSEETEQTTNKSFGLADDLLKTRLGDPIVSTYVTSFLIYNWEIFLHLASGDSADSKIEAINRVLITTYPDFALNNSLTFIYLFLSSSFVFPIIASIALLFVFPRIFRGLRKIILLNKVDSENDRFDSEEKLSPVKKKIQTLQDSLLAEVKKNDAANELSNSYKENIELNKREIQNLEKELIRYKNENAGLITKNQNLENEIKQFNETTIRFGDNDNSTSIAVDTIRKKGLEDLFVKVASQSTTGIVFRDAYPNHTQEMALFSSLGLFERDYYQNREIWKITEQGKKTYVGLIRDN